jgi:hypothetical protein
MSTLKANKLQPFSGDTIIITNDTVVTGSVTATEGFIGSLTGTATNATTAATASNITPAITSDGVNRILTSDGDGTVTAEANLTFNGNNLTILGSTTSSGDISFSTLGSNVIQTLTNIVPTGTASYVSGTTIIGDTNSTTYLNYGVNLVETITTQNYCAKLPQTPKTGKSTTVINISGADLLLFPNTGSGEINGEVGGYIVIPSDGQSYTFNCYENPLPGGWSAVSAFPGGTQTQYTGIISSSIGSWNNSTSGSSVLAFINNTTKILGNGAASFSINSYANFLPLQYETTGVAGNDVGSYYSPTQTWKRINSITLYTNITSSISGSLVTINTIVPIIIQNSNAYFFYNSGTTTPNFYNYTQDPSWTAFKSTTYNSWVAANVTTADAFLGTLGFASYGGFTNSVVPGAFTPTSNGSIYSTVVGGPGTVKFTMFLNPNVTSSPIGKMIGKSLIGSYYSSTLGSNIDVYTQRYFGLGIKNYSNDITQIQLQAKLNLLLA